MNTFRRWRYFVTLTWTDLIGLPRMLILQTAVLGGIALPILILAGLKRGHVEDLSEQLRTSPTGREIAVRAVMKGRWLTREDVEEFQKSNDRLDVAIPDLQVTGSIAIRPDATDASEECDITLWSTRPRDPRLKFYAADVIGEKEKAVVISSAVARQLGIREGQSVHLRFDRKSSGQSERQQLEVVVKRILPDDSDSKIGYVDLWISEQVQKFLDGSRVPELGWPAARSNAPDFYSSYLIFTKKSAPLDVRDQQEIVDRGYSVTEIRDDSIAPLFGLIRPDVAQDLICHRLHSELLSGSEAATIPVSPETVASKWTTRTRDDVVIAWPNTTEALINGRAHRLIGLMLTQRNWFRHSVLINPEFAFTYGADELSIRFPELSEKLQPQLEEVSLESGNLRLTLKNVSVANSSSENRNDTVAVEPDEHTNHPPAPALPEDPDPPATKSESMPIAIVPPSLLAHLDAVQKQWAEFEPAFNVFVPVPRTIRFSRLRIYAKTIFDVPFVTDELRRKHYAAESAESQIQEILHQDASLSLIVYVVAGVVCLVCFVTIWVLLSDSTERKRGEIGILRVMGVSRSGIFFLCVLRSIMILCCGLLTAFCVAIVFGFCLKAAGINTKLLLEDIVTVAGALGLASMIGAIIPARAASMCDPIETILEGRFR